MKINGYQLRDAIKMHETRKETASKQFSGSLSAFPDEKKPSPLSLATAVLDADIAIAKLQVVQMRYNLDVIVEVEGEGTMSLAQAIKTLGPLGRAEKLWKSALPSDSVYTRMSIRDKDSVQAKPTLEPAVIGTLVEKSAKTASAFRAAIALGNGCLKEYGDIDPQLFA